MNHDISSPSRRFHWLAIAGLAVAAAVIFVADLAFSHGYAMWVCWLTRLSATLRVVRPNAQAPRWLAATIAKAGDALSYLTCEVP